MDGGGLAAVLLADADGRIVDASGTGLDSLAPPGEALVGSPLVSVESEGTRLILPGHLEDARRDGETRYEVRGPIPGDVLPFAVQLRSLELHGTRLLRASVSRPDGKSGPGSDQASRARESLLRAIIDNLPFEFFARDRDEVCFLENPALASHWGTLLGMRPEDAKITPEELATWKATNRRALAGEVIHSEVTWEIRGERRAFDEVIAPIQLDGEVLGFLGLGIDVTERKRAEEGLRRREAEIRALVENTEDRIWSVDREYRLVVSNHHIDADLTARLGRPIRPGECVFHEALPGWMNEAWREHYDRALRGESFVVERQTGFFNPSEWWEFRIGPIRDDRGEVTGVLVIQRNITREKETRAALERSRAELAAIYEHAPVLMSVIDRDRRVLYANQAFTAFTGVDEVALREGRACGVFGCINATQDPRGCGFGSGCGACALRVAIADTFATGTPHHAVEYRATLERGAGRVDVVLFCATALLDQQDAPRLLLCMQDISEMVRISEALAESESRYRNIFENAAEGIFLSSPAGKLLSANPACARIFGFDSAATMLAGVTSVTDQLYASPEDRTQFRSLVERDGEVRGFQTSVRRRDGSRGWVSLTARVVRGVHGEIL